MRRCRQWRQRSTPCNPYPEPDKEVSGQYYIWVMFVPILSDPVVTLDGVSLSNVTLSYLDLDVTIRVENPNPVGADLQECPFTVMYQKGDSSNQIATGNTGNAKIPGNSSTVLKV